MGRKNNWSGRCEGVVMKKSMCCYCFKDVEYAQGQKPKTCPHCEMGYWSKPPTEERCFLFQREYIRYRKVDIARSEKALGDLYYLLQEYAIGKMKKMLKGKKILPEETLLENAAEAAFVFIKKYLEPDENGDLTFQIDKSFGGQLGYILLPILYGQKIIFQDEILSLNSHIDSTDKKEKMDLNNFTNFFNGDVGVNFFLDQSKEDDLSKSITKIIEHVGEEVHKHYDNIAAINFLAGVYHKINNAHLDFMDRYYETHGGIQVQSAVEATMNSIKDFILEKTY